MWFWLIKAIAGSILGNVTMMWFKDTLLGVYFYDKIENTYNWAAERYNIEVLKKEKRIMKKYPVLTKKIQELQERLEKLEK